MKRSVIFLGLSLVLAGCSLPRGAALQNEVLNESESETPSFQVVNVTRDITPSLATWPATGWAGHYHWFGSDTGPDSSVIQTGDVLSIAIWDNQENSLLSGDGAKLTSLPPMTVSSAGKIYMPYVGEVSVRGMSQPAARNRLQESLDDIAPSAQVQLSVEQGRNNSIDLVSGVGNPGRYPLENRNTKILTALALGGGISSNLRHPLVRLQRGGRTYETRADALLRDANRNVRLRGGDQIAVVEDDRTFNVLGAASQESVIYFEKEEMSAMEALSAMGGLQDSRANPKGILILREYEADDLKPGLSGPDMRQVVFTVNLTNADGLFAARQFMIQPGDTLLATESPVTAAQTILGLLGTVVGFSATVNNLTD
ncbi:polysaccharide biosynthesis/export family protein [Roseovarius sp. 2305UL8-3]|uniref:polysaccharide biosynthesis/export family protein n=1 Tax=Roseovarius conchicola TaxID=3121636 RepID=UPI003528B05D